MRKVTNSRRSPQRVKRVVFEEFDRQASKKSERIDKSCSGFLAWKKKSKPACRDQRLAKIGEEQQKRKQLQRKKRDKSYMEVSIKMNARPEFLIAFFESQFFRHKKLFLLKATL